MSEVRSSYDLLVVGGGINGAGIARDAAGRGLATCSVEQGDLAAHTSSASTKLIHGGLRYLEYYEFRLVREALASARCCSPPRRTSSGRCASCCRTTPHAPRLDDPRGPVPLRPPRPAPSPAGIVAASTCARTLPARR